MNKRLDLALAAIVGAVSVVPFVAVLDAELLNWDDDAVFTGNADLVGASLVRWAFSTTLTGHYQPFSWLAWGMLARTAGLQPVAFHALSLVTHALVVALVYLTAVRLITLGGLPLGRARLGAAGGALLFGVHPLRVEPVAWASAFPYLAALACALLSTLAYLASRTRVLAKDSTRSAAGARRLSFAAVGVFAASLLFRPIAFGLPLLFLVFDWHPLERFSPCSADLQVLRPGRPKGLHYAGVKNALDDGRRSDLRARALRLVANKTPYFVLAIAAAALEWTARQDSFGAIAAGPRATLALTAPFVYWWRTMAPIDLSPVDVLPLDAATSPLAIAGALVGLLAISVLAWRARKGWPGLLVAWIAFLLLVAPVVALGPTGLQATADRYTYLPSAAIAIAIGCACAMVPGRSVRGAAFGMALIAICTFGVLAWRQTSYWHDSIALWSRAAALDPRNDVALYNLGTALQAAGRADEATAAYEATLRLVPEHAPAQQNLRGLRAIARQRRADALAQSGDLAAAIPLYREALALDPARSRARAALGVALVQSDEFAAGAAEIETAVREGIEDPNLVNVQSYALMQLGRTAEAAKLLQAAVAKYPGDANLAHNLAILTDAREPARKK